MSLWTPNSLVDTLCSSYAGPVFEFDTYSNQGKQSNFHLESRTGAGSSLVGYLSLSQASDAFPAVARLSPAAFRASAPSLSALSASSAGLQRPPLLLIVHAGDVSGASNISSSSSFTLVPALSDVFVAINQIEGSSSEHPFSPAVLLADASRPAAGLEDTFTAASDLLSKNHDVVLVYDSLYAGQERKPSPVPTLSAPALHTVATPTTVTAETYRRDLAVAISQTAQRAFTYVGDPSAKHVLVLPASVHAETARASIDSLGSTLPVGLIVVHALRPWLASDFEKNIPDTTQTFHVFSENGTFGPGLLFPEVLASSLQRGTRVLPLKQPASPSSLHEWHDIITDLFPNSPAPAISSLVESASPAKLISFWSEDDSPSAKVPASITDTLKRESNEQVGTNRNIQSRLTTWYDNYSGSSVGVASSALLLSSNPSSRLDSYPLHAIEQSHSPSLLFLSDIASYINNSYDPLSSPNISPATSILLSTDWAPAEVHAQLSGHENISEILGDRSYVIDAEAVARTTRERDGAAAKDVDRQIVEEAAFWIFYFGSAETAKAETTVAQLLQRTSASLGTFEQALRLVQDTRRAIAPVPPLKNLEGGIEAATEAQAIVELPSSISYNSMTPNPYKEAKVPVASSKPNWHEAAQKVVFPEAFSYEKSMRPDLPEENFILTVTENRRLTPDDYDRNVFHMELSTKGTGLKYEIGEALGVHGWNDKQEVLDLIEYLNWGSPDSIVSFPARDDSNRVETRTLLQTLQQNLDVFGKPPKTFYEALSNAATDKNEARTLRFASSAEGSSTLKKWTDVDTYTYADLLRKFPNAKEGLGLQGLLTEVAHIKPRHYSIASSQNFVGDSVHLLVVTVDWETPEGETRYGQCTRYLASLPAGAEVTVSVKPSVMKLPPRDDQAIIMAGLGTGAAPFRAFIQERAWRKSRGATVGPLLYYFGSRYSAKEYLYGEEIEAYIRDGLITHAGLAFSRDKRKTAGKEYIQHKMHNDGKMLSELLTRQEAYFYLCGPTWPVPDVYESLVDSISQYDFNAVAPKHLAENEDVDIKRIAAEFVDSLKEEERYVLEVY